MTMTITLHGGFGEKGRTCIGVAHGSFRVLLDAGVKTSDRGRRDYHPAIEPAALASLDALVVTHAHEDHVAALGWCAANGFAGRVLMTDETRIELPAMLAGYAEPAERAAASRLPIERLAVGTSTALGPLRITTGRSGHVAGGVWLVVDDGRTRFAYCGDVVPASPVFAMDPLPPSDAIALDASYGDDDIPLPARAKELSGWIAGHARGVVLPTPLHGRSAELLAVVPGPLALAAGMRAALRAQLDQRDWLHSAALPHLEERLAAAHDWHPGEALPAAALLCDDGMGMAGPSRDILTLARSSGHPTLFTGHVPAGTLGADMMDDGLAHWIRLPTHPTRSENAALAARSGARLVLGHSCDAAALARLARHVPGLRATAATGDTLDL